MVLAAKMIGETNGIRRFMEHFERDAGGSLARARRPCASPWRMFPVSRISEVSSFLSP
jgi:hypothetical protein